MTEEEKLYGNNYQLRYEELKKKYDGLVALNRASLKEYEEQEKMIDLMAEYISGTDTDEDICKKVGKNQLCDEYGENSKCKECVIEYYKEKVKELKIVSEADKMIEELGYEKKERNNFITYIKYIGNGSRGITFSFSLEHKTVCADTFDEDYEINIAHDLDVEELKAINKKCEELRLAMIEEEDEFWEEFIKEQERLIEEEKIMRRIEGD